MSPRHETMASASASAGEMTRTVYSFERSTYFPAQVEVLTEGEILQSHEVGFQILWRMLDQIVVRVGESLVWLTIVLRCVLKRLGRDRLVLRTRFRRRIRRLGLATSEA